MELPIALSEDSFFAELMGAPTSELDLMQSPKHQITGDDSVNSVYSTNFHSPDRCDQLATNDYGTFPALYDNSSSYILLNGPNANTMTTFNQPNDDCIYGNIIREPDESKHESSFPSVFDDEVTKTFNPGDNQSFYPQKSAVTSQFQPHEMREAISVQVHGEYYPHQTGMIPSVVDHGAEAFAAVIKDENQPSPYQTESPLTARSGKNDVKSNSSQSSNLGPCRRRTSKGPKPKLHQRTEPYPDAEMETKRRNAIKAHKNRLKIKEEKETMEAEISQLKALLQEKEETIRRLNEEIHAEKGNRIRALQQELTQLTGQIFDSL